MASRVAGIPDVASAPGGYIWENAIKHSVSIRNYGFFIGDNPKTPQATEQEEPGNPAHQPPSPRAV